MEKQLFNWHEWDELELLVQMGWFQQEVVVADEESGEFTVEDYDESEGWSIYV